MRDSEVLKITKGGELLTVTVLCNYCETRFHSPDRREISTCDTFVSKRERQKAAERGTRVLWAGAHVCPTATLLNADVLNLVVDVLKRCAISVVERQWRNQYNLISIKNYSDWKVPGIKKRVLDRIHTLIRISKYFLT